MTLPRRATGLAALLGLSAGFARADELRLSVRSLDASSTLEAGEPFRYEVSAELVGRNSSGLASLRFDLAFEGGTLQPGEAPPEAAPFASPLGIENPGRDGRSGYGGTPSDGGLAQVGGAQDTLGTANEAVRVGLGVAPNPLPVLRARARLPERPGRYELGATEVAANVLVERIADTSAWRCTTIDGASQRALLVVIANDGSVELRALDPAPIAVANAVRPQPRMGEPLPGMNEEEERRFYSGLRAFSTEISEPEGLGPIFNDKSCVICHAKPAPGGFSEFSVSRFGRAGENFDPLIELGGPLHQAKTTTALSEEFIPSVADVVAQRTTPHTFGSGLVESIPDAILRAVAKAQPPELRGRVHVAPGFEEGAPSVGRFGWKAQVSTVLSFSAIASRDELGFTNRFLPDENLPNGDLERLKAGDPADDPEDRPDAHGLEFIDRVASFQRMLAPPPQTPRAGMRGEALFDAMGCSVCHVRSFATPVSSSQALSRVEFRPYSDFLLHDMGELADGIVHGDADGSEFRTAPLWGIATRITFLHDGRHNGPDFERIATDAILSHDGQARSSADAFRELEEEDRAAVIRFLRSLGRGEFDVEPDNDVDADDWRVLRPHLTGPDGALTPDDVGSIGDVDRDGDFDLADVQVLQRAL